MVILINIPQMSAIMDDQQDSASAIITVANPNLPQLGNPVSLPVPGVCVITQSF